MSEATQSKLTETWVAILMSLTALATAWSAYQANVWNGVQIFQLASAQDSQTLESQSVLDANQHRMMDGVIVLSIASALVEGHQKTVDFFIPRLRPELRDAFTAWIASDPLHNNKAPAFPIQMPEYIEKVVKKYSEEQASFHGDYIKKLAAAEQAGSIADNYVLMTVLFAMVLFFSGIASTFKSRQIEWFLLSVGTLLLLATLAKLATFPVSMD